MDSTGIKWPKMAQKGVRTTQKQSPVRELFGTKKKRPKMAKNNPKCHQKPPKTSQNVSFWPIFGFQAPKFAFGP